jgi:MFS family permease
VARSLAMGSRIGQPFFFLYAAYVLGISAEGDPARFGTTLAVLSLAYMGADTVTNLVWGYLSDRQGFRSTFVISLAINIVGVGALMMSHSVTTFAISFFMIGAAQSGYLMSTSNIVLEYGHRHDVPMRMALSNTAEGAMGSLAPLLGAGLVVGLGYEASFYATIITMVAALGVLVWKVDEPRKRRMMHIEPDGK